MTNYSTIYVGLLVDCVLDSGILGEKAAELVAAWPILGGILLKSVSRFVHVSHHTLLTFL